MKKKMTSFSLTSVLDQKLALVKEKLDIFSYFFYLHCQGKLASVNEALLAFLDVSECISEINTTINSKEEASLIFRESRKWK